MMKIYKLERTVQLHSYDEGVFLTVLFPSVFGFLGPSNALFST